MNNVKTVKAVMLSVASVLVLLFVFSSAGKVNGSADIQRSIESGVVSIVYTSDKLPESELSPKVSAAFGNWGSLGYWNSSAEQEADTIIAGLLIH